MLLGSSMAGTALPVRPGAPETPVPDWATPEQAAMLPGVLAGEAAVIDVPMLLATGERDVCRAPAE